MLRLLLGAVLISSPLAAKKTTHFGPIIAKAENIAGKSARKVLWTARRMAFQGVIIRGSCWDWLNAAFLRAGFGTDKREIVYRQSKRGPYAPTSSIRPGDWLYYINHSYGDIEHSGLFVGWINRSKKQGLILSYAGQKRGEPGRYRPYRLNSVYQIIRAKP